MRQFLHSFLVFLSVAGPCHAAEQGTAPEWIAMFLNVVEDPRTYEPDPDSALNLLGVDIVRKADCQREFALASNHPRFLVDAWGFMVGPWTDCADQHLGLLSVAVNKHDISADHMAQQITRRLGITPSRSIAGPNTILHWQREPFSAVEVVTSTLADDAELVILNVARFTPADRDKAKCGGLLRDGC